MKVMVMVKATEDSEAGVMPSRELLEAMPPFMAVAVDLDNVGFARHGRGTLTERPCHQQTHGGPAEEARCQPRRQPPLLDHAHQGEHGQCDVDAQKALLANTACARLYQAQSNETDQ